MLHSRLNYVRCNITKRLTVVVRMFVYILASVKMVYYWLHIAKERNIIKHF